jgi:hypothetical protein
MPKNPLSAKTWRYFLIPRIATLELQAVAGKREFTKTPETGDKSVVITKAPMLAAELKQPVVS